MLSIEDFPQLILFIVAENNDVQTARNVLRIFRNKVLQSLVIPVIKKFTVTIWVLQQFDCRQSPIRIVNHILVAGPCRKDRLNIVLIAILRY